MRVALFVLLLIFVFLLVDTRVNPVSISGGLTFEIPSKNHDCFYIHHEGKKYFLKEIHNLVTDKLETQVLFDGELVSDSGIGYHDTQCSKECKMITIRIIGDVDPKTTKGYYKKILAITKWQNSQV